MWSYNSFYDDPQTVLMHHGIQGQKWGVRRFQNADGSLTKEGRERYGAMAERSSAVADRAGKMAKASGAITAGIAAFDIAAILGGSSTILLPAGPAIALAASGAAYVASKLSNKHANKMLSNSEERDEEGNLEKTYNEKDPKLNSYIKKADAAKTDEEHDKWMRKYTDERDKKAGLKKSNNLPMDKESRMDRAKNEGKWDIEFLEAIQNSKIFIDGNKKAMLKEYDAYLDDPSDYWKNRGSKLSYY